MRIMNQELRIRNKKFGTKPIIRNSLFIIRKSEGFTLIELLIVVAIIGVLATVFISNFIGVRERARDSQRKQDLRQIQAALELYRYDLGTYPDTVNCGNSLSDELTPPTYYMKKVPCDPLQAPATTYYNNGSYYYTAPPEGTSYTLCACLENTNDNQGAANSTCGTGVASVPIAASTPAVVSVPLSPAGFFPNIANLIQGSVSLGEREVSGLFSKLAALIPKFGGQGQAPKQEVAGATSDSPSSTTGNQVSSLTWSHTVGLGTNRLLLVGISFFNGSIRSVDSVTYDGIHYLSRSGTVIGEANDRSEIWYLIAPDTGSKDIKITFLGGNVNVVAGATSWAEVDQDNPLGPFVWATTTGGGNTSPSVNVTSAAGEVVQDNLVAWQTTATAGNGQAVQWNAIESLSTKLGAASTEPWSSGTTVQMSWTLTSSYKWAIGAVSIKPAPAPTPTPTSPPSTPTPTSEP